MSCFHRGWDHAIGIGIVLLPTAACLFSNLGSKWWDKFDFIRFLFPLKKHTKTWSQLLKFIGSIVNGCPWVCLLGTQASFSLQYWQGELLDKTWQGFFKMSIAKLPSVSTSFLLLYQNTWNNQLREKKKANFRPCFHGFSYGCLSLWLWAWCEAEEWDKKTWSQAAHLMARNWKREAEEGMESC